MRTKIGCLMIAGCLVEALLYSPASSEQNVNELMKKKLANAQKVLEGLTTDDFEMISKQAKEMNVLSQAASFQVIQTPEYQYHSSNFRRITDSLSKNAEKKNLDGAALDYVKLTMSCVECHKYVRSVKIGKLDGFRSPETKPIRR